MRRRVALKRRVFGLKRVGIRKRSKKREQAYSGPDGRRVFVSAYLEEHPWCEIRHTCWRGKGSDSVDVHEKIPRSAMGAIVPGEKADEQGQVFFAVCRECHDYIHLHPKWAKEQGWIRGIGSAGI